MTYLPIILGAVLGGALLMRRPSYRGATAESMEAAHNLSNRSGIGGGVAAPPGPAMEALMARTGEDGANLADNARGQALGIGL